MIHLRARLILVSLLLTTAVTAAAEVRTILEPRLIDEMETVRLTLRVAGSTQVEPPDFAPLEKDFEVLGTQNSSRISSINGRTSAVIEYQVTLRPRRTGQLTIPALKIGDEYSETIELAVRPMDPGVRASIAEMIFFETEFTSNPVYVQAQTVLIRRLYYSNGVQIYSDLPGVPELPNAVVVPLGDTRSTTTVREGRRYGVIEQRFAVFPEQSGTLTIPSISVTSSVRLQSGGRTRRSGIRVATEELTLEVNPIPAEYPADEPWLPAESVALTDNLDPPGNSYDIGEHLTLSVNVDVTGNIASSIPPVSLGLNDNQFKVYPEAPVLTEDTAGQRIIGQRRETFALIPTAPGRVTLPAISLTWWDTASEQLRVSEIEPRTLQITGELPTPEATDAVPEEVTTAGVAPQQENPRQLLQLRTPQLYGIAGFLLLLGAAVLIYRYAPLPDKLRLQSRTQDPRRRLLKALRTSIRSNDLVAIKHDLGAYLAASYGSSPPEALSRFRREPVAAQLLRRLDLELYSPDADKRGDPGLDLDSLVTLAKQVGRQRPQAASELPPLYG